MRRMDRAGRLALALLTLLAVPALGQQAEEAGVSDETAAMMEAWQKAMTPGEPHADLARATGSWKMTSRIWMNPAAEPMISEGTAERTMLLGGRVLEETMTSTMMGMPFTGIARTGYDNVTGKYWTTWIDNMSTACYMSHGSMDAETGATTFHGEYDDPMTGGKIQIRSVVRWDGDDKQVFEWYEDRGEGEVKTMEITYERQGA